MADPDARVKSVIAGVLRQVIDTQGPIDVPHIGTATRRVLRQLQRTGYLFDVRRETTDALFMAAPQPCFICGTPTSRLDVHYGAPFCNSTECCQQIEDDLRRRDYR